MTSETDGDVEASAVPREVNSNDGNSCVCISADTKQTLKEMLDMELLKDPIFMLFTLSNIFTSIGFNIPYVYLVVSTLVYQQSEMNVQHFFDLLYLRFQVQSKTTYLIQKNNSWEVITSLRRIT